MKYKELFTDNNGLFTNIFAKYYTAEYNTIFGENTSELVDTYTRLNFGGRELMHGLTEGDYINNVRSVISLYVGEWVKGARVMQEEYNAVLNVSRQLERDINTTNNENYTNTDEESNKVFNETAFYPTEKTEISNERLNNGTTAERVTERKGVEDVGGALIKEFNRKLQSYKNDIIFVLIEKLTKSIYS